MNKIRFNRIEIQNFRSIKNKIIIDFKPGLYTIEGVNSDESCNNGAGKSSILSALYWCLTGNTITNEVLADEVVNFSAGKDCRVVLFMDTEQGEVKITRCRKDAELGNNLQLEICGQNLSCHKVADTQDRINKIIKLPLDLLKNTLIMNSDMESSFCELSPSQRVQVLENIRDYSIWDKVRDSANKDIKDYNKDIKEKELEQSGLSGSLNTYEKVLKDKEDEFIFETAQFKARDYISQIAKIQNVIDGVKKENIKLQTEKEELQKQIVSNDNTELNEKLSKINEEGLKLKQQKIDIETEVDKKVNDIGYEIRKIADEIEVINKWRNDDVCPTCHRKLDRTQEEITTKRNRQNELETKIKDLSEKSQKLINDKRQKTEEFDIKLAEIRTQYKTVNDKINEIKQQNAIIPNKLKEIENMIAKNTQNIDKYNSDMVWNKRQIEIFEDYNKRHAEEMEKYKIEINTARQKIRELEVELHKLEGKRKMSTFFYELLGPKGKLRPYLLTQDIEYLNGFMQHYISRFFTGTNVKLKLEENNIKILIKTNEGIEKNVSSLSGGEKKRLNISIQLALFDLMQTVSQTNFNMLWLDEVETQMDPLGCQQFIDIIEDKSGDIETVYWITNNDMVKENTTKKLICKKQAGITTVEELS